MSDTFLYSVFMTSFHHLFPEGDFVCVDPLHTSTAVISIHPSANTNAASDGGN